MEKTPEALAQRFPTEAATTIHFVQPDGRKVDGPARSGEAIDVSVTGQRLRIDDVPADVAAQLRDPAAGLTLDLTVRFQGKEYRLSAICRWLRPLENGAHLLGVEYTSESRDRGAALARAAEARYLKPLVRRKVQIAAGVVAALAVILVISVWASQAGARRRAENELSQAMQARSETAQRLLDLENKVAREPDSEALRKELERVRSEFEALRQAVAEKSIDLADARLEPGTTAADHVERGHRFFSQGNLAGALAEYNEAVRRDRTRAAAWLKIAMINELYGQEDEALDAYARYLQNAPNAADAYEVEQRVLRLFKVARGEDASESAPETESTPSGTDL